MVHTNKAQYIEIASIMLLPRSSSIRTILKVSSTDFTILQPSGVQTRSYVWKKGNELNETKDYNYNNMHVNVI